MNFFKPLFYFAVGMVALLSFGDGRLSAQTFTVLHGFASTTNAYRTNFDGANPAAELITSGGVLYGTANFGGTGHAGTVYRMNLDGSGFTNLHSFVTADGTHPRGGLVLSGTTLYGTTLDGTSANYGSIFSLGTDGTGYKILHTFAYSDGANPSATLVLSNGVLYGTTQSGGYDGGGSVFRINTDGSGFTNLYFFTGGDDGDYPSSALVLSGGMLYGTTGFGGVYYGTVFALGTNGTHFTNLYTFSSTSSEASATNSDGAYPFGALVFSGNALYGMADGGGCYGAGTLYRINTNGTGFTNLYNFPGGTGGANPLASLIASGNLLYGTTASGGTTSNGTVFQINNDGTGYKTLHSFTTVTNAATGINADGRSPDAGLVMVTNILFGTAYNGGVANNGTLFSVDVTPAAPLPLLRLTVQGKFFQLAWPAAATNYVLQTTTNLALKNWTTMNVGSPGTTIILLNGSPAAFFRLYPK